MTNAWTCNECDAQFALPDLTAASIPVCEVCESTDINEPVIPNRVFDDVAAEKRIAEIRAESAVRYAAMDTLIEVARGNYDVPSYSEGFLKVRQAS